MWIDKTLRIRGENTRKWDKRRMWKKMFFLYKMPWLFFLVCLFHFAPSWSSSSTIMFVRALMVYYWQGCLTLVWQIFASWMLFSLEEGCLLIDVLFFFVWVFFLTFFVLRRQQNWNLKKIKISWICTRNFFSKFSRNFTKIKSSLTPWWVCWCK